MIFQLLLLLKLSFVLSSIDNTSDEAQLARIPRPSYSILSQQEKIKIKRARHSDFYSSDDLSNVQRSLSRFPNHFEVTELAEHGETAGLLKITQIMLSDKLIPCNYQQAYILDLLGSIKFIIQRKNSAAQEMQDVIDTAKLRISHLEQQLNKISQLKRSLNIEQLAKSINESNFKLQNTINRAKMVQIQINLQEARVLVSSKEIDRLTRQNNIILQKIGKQRTLLIQTNKIIQQIEAKINQAKNQRSNLMGNIQKGRQKIAQNNFSIQKIRKKEAETAKTIAQYLDQLDDQNKNAKNIEVDLYRARVQSLAALSKDLIFTTQIKKYSAQATLKQLASPDEYLQFIRVKISQLIKTVPYIQIQIKKQECKHSQASNYGNKLVKDNN